MLLFFGAMAQVFVIVYKNIWSVQPSLYPSVHCAVCLSARADQVSSYQVKLSFIGD